MAFLQDFPLEYALVREYVAMVHAPHFPFEELGNEDVFIQLKDGREFGFTVFSLQNAKHLMDQNNLKALVAPGMIIVSRVTWDTILFAFEECLRLSIGNGNPLEHFGILQTSASE